MCDCGFNLNISSGASVRPIVCFISVMVTMVVGELKVICYVV